MDTNYNAYIETISGLEEIEQQATTDNKSKSCCYLSLAFVRIKSENLLKINVR